MIKAKADKGKDTKRTEIKDLAPKKGDDVKGGIQPCCNIAKPSTPTLG
jgi:hypothetical protein